MSTGGSGVLASGVVVSYDYGTDDKSSSSSKPPVFNGDPNTFSWWKTKMYSYIMGLDEELWQVLEDGVDDLELDEEGVVVDRKKHTAAQKKMYKKHHRIRGIIVASLPHKEYLKMSDKTTAKAMFASLCSNHKGNKNYSGWVIKLLWWFIIMNYSGWRMMKTLKLCTQGFRL
jgi:hypothetical protein